MSGTEPSMQIDTDARTYRYYRHAVEKHWDPHEIDLAADREALADLDDVGFEGLKRALALFGAGEDAVAEDLAPLSVVLDDFEDQLFITTQLYEEAKHADFFDRYWREVIHPAEDDRGAERSSPADERWFSDEYDELFERNERAMARLLDDDTPENRAKAYSHYHMTVEGILAQTGYYGLTRQFDTDTYPDVPHLPGLVEGLTSIRSDEGRHVGFGMAKLKELVESERVDPSVIEDTVGELLPLVQASIPDYESDEPGIEPNELVEYATSKHGQRMQQITAANDSIPDVDELTALGD
ncbi:ribonucleotide-diphosphate reductase subunit beta [Halococcus thailandensis]|uniref:Ribonucleotide reductase beta subunit-like protein n=1 Tax=Halococcus thailandensis JCM 13552 TaxID=1227457 RepID=M0N0M2_9EURY|nr:ribonucleotide-diphosphate reductase subunit beta [Halococcus thailandensis]EMA51093.1 Ribonucleotide reductase beta subunit-like protein [Halococcus thailandensis JCM 13552]